MTHEREAATVTNDRSRADVLTRLARLTDPETDDRARTLDARAALDRLGGPALAVDLDGTILDANEQTAALGIDRETLRGRALWSAPLWATDDASSIMMRGSNPASSSWRSISRP